MNRHTPAICLAALLALGASSPAAPAATAASSGDLAFASYAFAPELGSGIYESNGRALQIYRLPFAFDQEGWRLTLPVTLSLIHI